jgi:micrococcal nuclease
MLGSRSSLIGPVLWLLACLALAGCSEAGDSSSSGVAAGTRLGTVTAVSDGDTVRLAGIGRVRLIGVDTPEVYGRDECYGHRASAAVRRWLPAGSRVRYVVGREERDRYGRLLAYVWLPDGRFLNRLLVERGYAQPLTIPPNVEYADQFVRAARRARRAGRGLWGIPGCAAGG